MMSIAMQRHCAEECHHLRRNATCDGHIVVLQTDMPQTLHKYFFRKVFPEIIYIHLFWWRITCLLMHVYRVGSPACGNRFSPSTMWVLVIKLKVQDLEASPFILELCWQTNQYLPTKYKLVGRTKTESSRKSENCHLSHRRPTVIRWLCQHQGRKISKKQIGRRISCY